MKKCFAVLVMIPLLACVGCGDDGRACAAATDCGGDVVGNWEVTDSCVDLPGDLYTKDCPQAKVSASVTMDGTLSLRANRTLTFTSTTHGSVAMTTPASCLTYNGLTLTCAQLNQAFAAMLSGGADSPFRSASCADAGGGSCSCNFTMNPETETEAGTYSTTGNVLTLHTDSLPEKFNYCVKGDELALARIPDPDDPGKFSLLLKRQ